MELNDQTTMNHKDRRKAKRKRWLQRKKEQAAEGRRKDREKRIQERTEQLLAMRAKDSQVQEEERPCAPEPAKKKGRLAEDVKEIKASHIVLQRSIWAVTVMVHVFWRFIEA